MGRRACAVVVCLGGILGPVAAGQESLSTPEMLVQLARDQGLSRRGNQTPTDVRQIRTLLQAAVRLDPRLFEAHQWLYELAVLGGDPQAARTAAGQLVAADPAHLGAFIRLVETSLADCQSVEQRRDWLQSALREPGRTPEQRARLHLELARVHQSQLDPAGAREALEQAAQLDPWEPEIAVLQLQLLPPDAEPAAQLSAWLKLLQLSPFTLEAAWNVALLFDEAGLYDEADPFYRHAAELQQRIAPNAAPPGPYSMQLARHELARDNLAGATSAVEQAINDPTTSAQAAMLYGWLLSQQERLADAEMVKRRLAERFARLRDPADWPVDEVAQAAWFYLILDAQPQRALALAEAAALRAPGDRFAQRVLGWAQVENLQTEAGSATLAPLAATDSFAAYRLARLRKDNGDPDGASQILRNLEPVPPAGPARALLDSLELPGLERPAPAQRSAPLRDAWAAFPRDVLRLHQRPADFLRVAVEWDERSLNPGMPWRATFSLTNTASFPITLGPDWMANPLFLLSFELEGDRTREYPHLFTVALDAVRVLAPGATVRLERTVDVGPLRQALRLTPQHVQRATVHALFDPLRGADGQWRPGLCGQAPRPTYVTRLPARASREALHATFAALTGDSDRSRYAAVELLSELLGERQRAELGRLRYHPEAISSDRVRAALLAALQAESWELRVRTLESLHVTGLDPELFEAVRRCLRHPHWLVRLMAVRLLGERDAQQSRSALAELAQADGDELVRALAESYVEAPASAPATQAAGAE